MESDSQLYTSKDMSGKLKNMAWGSMKFRVKKQKLLAEGAVLPAIWKFLVLLRSSFIVFIIHFVCRLIFKPNLYMYDTFEG